MEIPEMIAVMKAYADGKEIEARNLGRPIDKEWKNVRNPSWNFDSLEYRIKPQGVQIHSITNVLIEIRPYSAETKQVVFGGNATLISNAGAYKLAKELAKGAASAQVPQMPLGVVNIDPYLKTGDKPHQYRDMCILKTECGKYFIGICRGDEWLVRNTSNHDELEPLNEKYTVKGWAKIL